MTMRWSAIAMLVVLGMMAPAYPGHAQEIPDSTPWTLENVLKHVPPLKHDAGDRLPLISLPVFVKGADDKSYEKGQPLAEADYRELGRRGLTQHIALEERFIPIAKALQKAGNQVVVLQFGGGRGPGGDGPDPLHKLPAGYRPDPGEVQYVCPMLKEGWHAYAGKLRDTLRKFKSAGAAIDAIWLDIEVEPEPDALHWKQARACTRCRAKLPAGVLADKAKYIAYIHQLRHGLWSDYAAATIAEVFPSCKSTNWEQVFSSEERPVWSWLSENDMPRLDIGKFTHSNPVALGFNFAHRLYWKNEWMWPLDASHMDRCYTHMMLLQVSVDAANRQKMVADKSCVVWVNRSSANDPNAKVPELSRARYREILRHLWLRGADTMMIFNSTGKTPGRAIEELKDVVGVYDEMLAHREFLDKGEVLNTAVPEPPDDGAVWSGLRLGDQAMVRAFTQGAKPATFSVTPWESGPAASLEATPAGVTFVLTRNGDKVDVKKEEGP